MTDRHAGYVVTLDQAMRDDDAAETITALRQIKGVVSVAPIIQTGEMASQEMLVEARVKARLVEVLAEFMRNLFNR